MKQQYRSAYDKLAADEVFREKLVNEMKKSNSRRSSPARWMVPVSAAACLCLLAAILFPLFRNSLVPDSRSSFPGMPANSAFVSSDILLPSSNQPEQTLKDEADARFASNPLDTYLNQQMKGMEGESQTAVYERFTEYWMNEIDYAANELAILMQSAGEDPTLFQNELQEWMSEEPDYTSGNSQNGVDFVGPAALAKTKYEFYRNCAQRIYVRMWTYQDGGKVPFYYQKSIQNEEILFAGWSERLGEYADNINLESDKTGSFSLKIVAPFSSYSKKAAFGDTQKLGTSLHTGVELLPSNFGDSVLAGVSGKVVFADDSSNGKGVVIQTNSNEFVLYGHLYQLTVIPGETVEVGTALGPCAMDNGEVYLHLAVWSNGEFVNPEYHLSF